MNIALTIAGSDCSGGAGIQADLKTFACHKVYGESVITSLTAQNTTGVFAIEDVSSSFVAKQLDAVFTDIFPDAVKIGMVGNSDIIKIIAEKLQQYGAKNIVLDPVMVSTSRCKLISDDACATLASTLIPVASLITPNIPEAEVLTKMKITGEGDMINSAKSLSEKFNVPVLLKGGHSVNDSNDVLYHNGLVTWYNSPRIENNNTHGTGCTLSSAIAANLAKGFSLDESIKNAKNYLTGALKAGLNLGHGSGPLDHTYNL
ncbi:MAG: bifunctional hydroxymethylpyrimidine kinase/phosphomethylpyrimidine kinase [Synergistaceae bacterium]|nr:bifunctional hydroxymethylpyrimidine kinase/phosphomethylpyrimidine kinase [Synergistaceae bacterium]